MRKRLKERQPITARLRSIGLKPRLYYWFQLFKHLEDLQHENDNLNNTVKELKERLMLHAEDSDDELFTEDNITRKLTFVNIDIYSNIYYLTPYYRYMGHI